VLLTAKRYLPATSSSKSWYGCRLSGDALLPLPPVGCRLHLCLTLRWGVQPSNHGTVIANVHHADEKTIQAAIKVGLVPCRLGGDWVETGQSCPKRQQMLPP